MEALKYIAVANTEVSVSSCVPNRMSNLGTEQTDQSDAGGGAREVSGWWYSTGEPQRRQHRHCPDSAGRTRQMAQQKPRWLPTLSCSHFSVRVQKAVLSITVLIADS